MKNHNQIFFKGLNLQLNNPIKTHENTKNQENPYQIKWLISKKYPTRINISKSKIWENNKSSKNTPWGSDTTLAKAPT